MKIIFIPVWVLAFSHPIDFSSDISLFLSLLFESAHCSNVVIRAFHNTSNVWSAFKTYTVSNIVMETNYRVGVKEKKANQRWIMMSERKSGRRSLFVIHNRILLYTYAHTKTLSPHFALPFLSTRNGSARSGRYNRTLCTKTRAYLWLFICFFFWLGSRLSFEWACEEGFVWRNDVDDADDVRVDMCMSVCLSFFGIRLS